MIAVSDSCHVVILSFFMSVFDFWAIRRLLFGLEKDVFLLVSFSLYSAWFLCCYCDSVLE